MSIKKALLSTAKALMVAAILTTLGVLLVGCKDPADEPGYCDYREWRVQEVRDSMACTKAKTCLVSATEYARMMRVVRACPHKFQ